MLSTRGTGLSSRGLTGSLAGPRAACRLPFHDLPQLLHRRARRGYLTGTEARPVLLQSGLPTADLKTIWDLADPVRASHTSIQPRRSNQRNSEAPPMACGLQADIMRTQTCRNRPACSMCAGLRLCNTSSSTASTGTTFPCLYHSVSRPPSKSLANKRAFGFNQRTHP
jgi:hypothetical protein